jgi:hypothetical protein
MHSPGPKIQISSRNASTSLDRPGRLKVTGHCRTHQGASEGAGQRLFYRTLPPSTASFCYLILRLTCDEVIHADDSVDPIVTSKRSIVR